jgi:hypothetical protein
MSRIIADETPVQLTEKARIILHAIPFSAFDSRLYPDITILDKNIWLLSPIYSTVSGGRYNSDGLISYSGTEDVPGREYLQGFRNGIMESVDSSMLRFSQQRSIPTKIFEEEIVKALQTFVTIYQMISVAPPIEIMLSLIGVKGYKLGISRKINQWNDHVNYIDRDTLLLPDVVTENFSASIPTVLRPIFDAMWNSAGWQKSLGYDEQGEWGKGPNFFS